MTREEFDTHWRGRETPEFLKWFVGIFGYDCTRSDGDDYWDQRIFAFMGWKGSKKFYSEDYYDKALRNVEAAIDELKQR